MTFKRFLCKFCNTIFCRESGFENKCIYVTVENFKLETVLGKPKAINV